jgi:hypothetical protein
VNARRPIVYVLLSLLLVLSQQMGIAHALTHWSSQRTALTAGERTEAAPSKSLAALDQSCDQCLAFAQIGTAVDTASYSFPITRDNATAVDPVATPELCQRTICVFRSRAPPVLS